MKRKAVPEELEEPPEEISGVESAKPAKVPAHGKEAGVSHELKNAKSHLYCPPTSDEINQLKETENLYKNSLFRMQIGYLLDEVRTPEKKCKHVDGFLHLLRDFVNALKPSKEHEMSDLSWLPSDVAFPVPNLTGRTSSGNFKFQKPNNVTVVGSYLLKTTVKPNLNVDVALEMPKEMFNSRDFINFRYHFKRAAYLTLLASKLNTWDQVDSVVFSRIQNDPYKPFLVVKPSGKAGKLFTVNIYPKLPDDLFKLFKFSPSRNNIRHCWYDGKESTEKDEQGAPTPHYNQCMLHDILFGSHLKFLHRALNDCLGLKDAIILLKVWLHQRSLNQGPNAINGFMMSMFLAHMLTISKISHQMSSYQILRVAFKHFAMDDWTKEGISMAATDHVEFQPSIEDFHKHCDVVVVDPSGFMNLFGHVGRHAYNQFRHEAQLAIDFLDEKHTDSFEALFIKPVLFTRMVDHYFTLPSLVPLKWTKKDETFKEQIVDHGGDWKAVAIYFLHGILDKGLGARVKLLISKSNTDQQWKISKKPPKFSVSSLTCGILLDTEHYTELINMGPPADSSEAFEFRKFWGDRSELRRFQDGSINEAVVWKGDSGAERRMICKQIVSYLIERYGKCPSDSLHYVGDQLDKLIMPKYRLADSSKPGFKGSGENQLHNVIMAFDGLSKQIKALKEIPLAIKTIQGVSSVFRMTEIFPPRPCSISKDKPAKDAIVLPQLKDRQWVPAAEVVLQFESSGRWPEDIAAIQNLKAALHLKLAELLRLRCHLVAIATARSVKVVKDGYVFVITICHYREMVLLRSNPPDANHLKKAHEQQANGIERRLVTLPLHTSFVHGLHQEHASYALTTRLAKRWIASQMLLRSHLSEEAIELIVAHLYLLPAPFTKPSCHVNGFVRFLDLIASFDWQNEPLIININNSLTDEDYIKIREHFTSHRDQLPPMFISAPHDKMMSQFTKTTPSQQVLKRLTILASAAEKSLESALSSDDDIKQIFRPPLSGYDAVIQLDEDTLPRAYEAVDASTAIKAPGKTVPKCCALPVVNFNPARIYLDELQDSFGDIAMFFHDECGGSIIGIVWKSSATKEESFKVLSAGGKIPRLLLNDQSKTPEEQSTKVVPNLPAILSDMKIMGRGLVRTITSQ